MLMMMIAEVKKMIIDHYDRLKWNHLALCIENMLHYYGWIVSKKTILQDPDQAAWSRQGGPRSAEEPTQHGDHPAGEQAGHGQQSCRA